MPDCASSRVHGIITLPHTLHVISCAKRNLTGLRKERGLGGKRALQDFKLFFLFVCLRPAGNRTPETTNMSGRYKF